MTARDAASLLCAVYGSETVQESASVLLALKGLPASPQFRTQRPKPYQDPERSGPPLFTLAVGPSHSVVDGLAAALEIFDREEEFSRQISPPMLPGKQTGLYARFSVQYPQYFASLTVGVHGRFSEVWVYGRRQKLKSWQIRECNEDAMREIAACLRTA